MTTTKTDALFGALAALDRAWRDDLDTDEIVELWTDAEYALRQLGQIVKMIADDAAGRLLDRDDPMSDYTTQHGETVHLGKGYAPVRWRGHDLLRSIARETLDRSNGEIAETVRLDVLHDVLPGCGAEDSTSSKWLVGGLRRHVEGWQRYRSAEQAPLVIRRGPREW